MTHPGHSRPMAVSEVDEDGAFWFLSSRTSEVFVDITRDPRVNLYFAKPADQEFLTIHG